MVQYIDKDFLRGLLRTIKTYKDEPADRIIGRLEEKIERVL